MTVLSVRVVFKSDAYGATIRHEGSVYRASSTSSEVSAARAAAAKCFGVLPEEVSMKRVTSGNIPMGKPWIFDAWHAAARVAS